MYMIQWIPDLIELGTDTFWMHNVHLKLDRHTLHRTHNPFKIFEKSLIFKTSVVIIGRVSPTYKGNAGVTFAELIIVTRDAIQFCTSATYASKILYVRGFGKLNRFFSIFFLIQFYVYYNLKLIYVRILMASSCKAKRLEASIKVSCSIPVFIKRYFSSFLLNPGF